jgi:hypothetical protein
MKENGRTIRDMVTVFLGRKLKNIKENGLMIKKKL